MQLYIGVEQTAVVHLVVFSLFIIIFPVSGEICGHYYDLHGNYRASLNCSEHITGPYCCGEQYNRTCCSNQRDSIYWPNNKLHSIDQAFNVSATTVFFITFVCLVLVFTMSITCCCFRCCQDDLPRYSIHADDIDSDSDDNNINMEVGGLDWDDSAHNSIKSFFDDDDDDDNKDKVDSNTNDDNEYARETDPLNRQTESNNTEQSNSTNGTREFQDKC